MDVAELDHEWLEDQIRASLSEAVRRAGPVVSLDWAVPVLMMIGIEMAVLAGYSDAELIAAVRKASRSIRADPIVIDMAAKAIPEGLPQ